VSPIHQIEDAEDGNMMYDSDQIAHQVKKNNIFHFAQAKDTPLSKVGYSLQEYNLSESNELALKQQSKQILQILSGKRTDISNRLSKWKAGRKSQHMARAIRFASWTL
jgi:exopolysaccharide biosynthesis protein